MFKYVKKSIKNHSNAFNRFNQVKITLATSDNLYADRKAHDSNFCEYYFNKGLKCWYYRYIVVDSYQILLTLRKNVAALACPSV